MSEAEKQKLLELIEMYASFHGMYKEQLNLAINCQVTNYELMKQIRDEKFMQIKSIIEAL